MRNQSTIFAEEESEWDDGRGRREALWQWLGLSKGVTASRGAGEEEAQREAGEGNLEPDGMHFISNLSEQGMIS